MKKVNQKNLVSSLDNFSNIIGNICTLHIINMKYVYIYVLPAETYKVGENPKTTLQANPTIKVSRTIKVYIEFSNIQYIDTITKPKIKTKNTNGI